MNIILYSLVTVPLLLLLWVLVRNQYYFSCLTARPPCRTDDEAAVLFLGIQVGDAPSEPSARHRRGLLVAMTILLGSCSPGHSRQRSRQGIESSWRAYLRWLFVIPAQKNSIHVPHISPIGELPCHC